MSSYDPPEKEETGSSQDPGVKEKEITEEREFRSTLAGLSRSDFILYGAALGLPAGGLTILLMTYLFPGFEDTAAEWLRWLWDLLPV
ncbi:hypothetical protein GJ629_04660 [Halapricum sp. CBA1109]|uniref:hypothetical protein n=1 Tax=Halapricum sp. CBA1109 TaxID=2668068 RepID=UPI0012FAA9F7|nr:hypothetical protein [Halapricum sp. CBA1109]MUV89276.1 hypothetical protein [Halapricum sp. CBA1109]